MIDNATTIVTTVTETVRPGPTNTSGACQSNEGLRSSLKKKNTAVIALGVVFGVAMLALAGLLWSWWKRGEIIKEPGRRQTAKKTGSKGGPSVLAQS
jgi:hypothetical protein